MLDEDSLRQGVELGEGLAALRSERLSRIQHRRNPPLLTQWEAARIRI